MRFGAFTIADTYPDRGGRDPIRGAVALAEAVEAAGLDHFWVAEHHFGPAGALPAPPVVLAAVAARTTRLRLGPLVSVLPLHEPIALAEEYASLDRLSAGRLELAVGSGYMHREFRGFGRDPNERGREFDENLTQVISALRGEKVRSTPSATAVRLNVRPVQQPHPPVWVAAGRPDAVRSIGRRGLGVALIPYATLDRLDDLPAVVETYRSALPAGAVPRVLVALHAGIGPTLERIELLQRFLDSRPEAGDLALAELRRRRPGMRYARALVEAGLTLLGPAAVLRERVHWLERIGVTDIAGIFDFGGATDLEAISSVRAWGSAFGLAPPAVPRLGPGSPEPSRSEWAVEAAPAPIPSPVGAL